MMASMACEFGKVIVIRRDGKDGPAFPLTAAVCLFGRSDECDVRVQLPEVSREHCKLVITPHNGTVTLVNLSKINPTIVNSKPVMDAKTLCHCDVFTIADRSFRLELPTTASPHRVLQPLDVPMDQPAAGTSATPGNSGKAIAIVKPSTPGSYKSPARQTPVRPTNENHSRGPSPPRRPALPPTTGDVVAAAVRPSTPTRTVATARPKSPARVPDAGLIQPAQVTEARTAPPATGMTPPRAPANAATKLTADSDLGKPVSEAKLKNSSPSRTRATSPARSPARIVAKPAGAVKVTATPASTSPARSPARIVGKPTGAVKVMATPVAASISPARVAKSPARSPARVATKSAGTVKGTATPVTSTSPARSPARVGAKSAGTVKGVATPVGLKANKTPRGTTPAATKKLIAASPSVVQFDLVTAQTWDVVSTSASPKPRKSSSKATTPKSVGKSPASGQRGVKRSASPLKGGPARKKAGVSFGPEMSPELFDERLPPKTPVKRGTATPKRASMPAAGILKALAKGRRRSVGAVTEEPENTAVIVAGITPPRVAGKSPRSVTPGKSPNVKNPKSPKGKSPKSPSGKSPKSPKGKSPKALTSAANKSPSVTKSPTPSSRSPKAVISTTPEADKSAPARAKSPGPMGTEAVEEVDELIPDSPRVTSAVKSPRGRSPTPRGKTPKAKSPGVGKSPVTGKSPAGRGRSRSVESAQKSPKSPKRLSAVAAETGSLTELAAITPDNVTPIRAITLSGKKSASRARSLSGAGDAAILEFGKVANRSRSLSMAKRPSAGMVKTPSTKRNSTSSAVVATATVESLNVSSLAKKNKTPRSSSGKNTSLLAELPQSPEIFAPSPKLSKSKSPMLTTSGTPASTMSTKKSTPRTASADTSRNVPPKSSKKTPTRSLSLELVASSPQVLSLPKSSKKSLKSTDTTPLAGSAKKSPRSHSLESTTSPAVTPSSSLKARTPGSVTPKVVKSRTPQSTSLEVGSTPEVQHPKSTKKSKTPEQSAPRDDVVSTPQVLPLKSAKKSKTPRTSSLEVAPTPELLQQSAKKVKTPQYTSQEVITTPVMQRLKAGNKSKTPQSVSQEMVSTTDIATPKSTKKTKTPQSVTSTPVVPTPKSSKRSKTPVFLSDETLATPNVLTPTSSKKTPARSRSLEVLPSPRSSQKSKTPKSMSAENLVDSGMTPKSSKKLTTTPRASTGKNSSMTEAVKSSQKSTRKTKPPQSDVASSPKTPKLATPTTLSTELLATPQLKSIKKTPKTPIADSLQVVATPEVLSQSTRKPKTPKSVSQQVTSTPEVVKSVKKSKTPRSASLSPARSPEIVEPTPAKMAKSKKSKKSVSGEMLTAGEVSQASTPARRSVSRKSTGKVTSSPRARSLDASISPATGRGKSPGPKSPSPAVPKGKSPRAKSQDAIPSQSFYRLSKTGGSSRSMSPAAATGTTSTISYTPGASVESPKKRSSFMSPAVNKSRSPGATLVQVAASLQKMTSELSPSAAKSPAKTPATKSAKKPTKSRQSLAVETLVQTPQEELNTAASVSARMSASKRKSTAADGTTSPAEKHSTKKRKSRGVADTIELEVSPAKKMSKKSPKASSGKSPKSRQSAGLPSRADNLLSAKKDRKAARLSVPLAVVGPVMTPAKMVAMHAVYGKHTTPRLSEILTKTITSSANIPADIGETPDQDTSSSVSKKSAAKRTTTKSTRKTPGVAVGKSGKKSAAKKTLWSEIVKRQAAAVPTTVTVSKEIVKQVAVVKTKKSAAKTALSGRTPRRVIHAAVSSTGHIDSPATIVIGRAARRSFVASTSDLEASTDDIPPTPDGPGEMAVSPINSSAASSRRHSTISPPLSGIRQLLKTPRARKSAAKRSPKLAGVRDLLKTPKPAKSPALGGIKTLLKTPKPAKSPILAGVRELLKTPKPVASPVLGGVKKLLKTPKPVASPVVGGLKRLLKTPKPPKAVKSPALDGVRKFLKTPRNIASPALNGLDELFQTPASVGFVAATPTVTKTKKSTKKAKLTKTPEPLETKETTTPVVRRGKKHRAESLENQSPVAKKRKIAVPSPLPATRTPEPISEKTVTPPAKKSTRKAKNISKSTTLQKTKRNVQPPTVVNSIDADIAAVQAAIASPAPATRKGRKAAATVESTTSDATPKKKGRKMVEVIEVESVEPAAPAVKRGRKAAVTVVAVETQMVETDVVKQKVSVSASPKPTKRGGRAVQKSQTVEEAVLQTKPSRGGRAAKNSEPTELALKVASPVKKVATPKPRRGKVAATAESEPLAEAVPQDVASNKPAKRGGRPASKPTQVEPQSVSSPKAARGRGRQAAKPAQVEEAMPQSVSSPKAARGRGRQAVKPAQVEEAMPQSVSSPKAARGRGRQALKPAQVEEAMPQSVSSPKPVPLGSSKSQPALKAVSPVKKAATPKPRRGKVQITAESQPVVEAVPQTVTSPKPTRGGRGRPAAKPKLVEEGIVQTVTSPKPARRGGRAAQKPEPAVTVPASPVKKAVTPKPRRGKVETTVADVEIIAVDKKRKTAAEKPKSVVKKPKSPKKLKIAAAKTAAKTVSPLATRSRRAR